MKKPAVPIGPVHQRRDAKAPVFRRLRANGESFRDHRPSKPQALAKRNRPAGQPEVSKSLPVDGEFDTAKHNPEEDGFFS